MIGEADDDPILRLPLLEPDRVRGERVRARCRAVLARRRHIASSPRPRKFTSRVIEAALVGGFCLTYLTALVLDVLRLLTRI